jgi:hypothetical protein
MWTAKRARLPTPQRRPSPTVALLHPRARGREAEIPLLIPIADQRQRPAAAPAARDGELVKMVRRRLHRKRATSAAPSTAMAVRSVPTAGWSSGGRSMARCMFAHQYPMSPALAQQALMRGRRRIAERLDPKSSD